MRCYNITPRPLLLSLAGALQLAVLTSALSIARSSSSSSSSSSDVASTNGSLTYQQNLTTLVYPNCTVNAASNWCGIVFGMTAFTSNDTVFYNVSITDSSCQRVGRTDGIHQNSTTNLSTSVGDWTFKIYDGSGLDMLYNGVDIGNSSLFGEGNDDDDGYLGLEEFNMSASSLTTVIYGSYGNCTPASKAKSEGGPVRGQMPGALATLSVGVISVVFFAFT